MPPELHGRGFGMRSAGGHDRADLATWLEDIDSYTCWQPAEAAGRLSTVGPVLVEPLDGLVFGHGGNLGLGDSDSVDEQLHQVRW